MNVLSYIDQYVYDRHKEILELYRLNYEPMRKQHKKFCRAWHAEFMHEHRFLNRVVYWIICSGIFEERTEIIDLGCYDGMLVHLLRNANYDCYGYEQYPWEIMYELLEIREYINVSVDNCEIAVMLNYAHTFNSETLFPFIKKICGGLPKIIFFDREKRNKNPNNKNFYDKQFLKKYNIVPLSLPIFGDSIETQRDLLICQP